MNIFQMLGSLIYLILQIVVRLAILCGFIAVILFALFLFLAAIA